MTVPDASTLFICTNLAISPRLICIHQGLHIDTYTFKRFLINTINPLYPISALPYDGCLQPQTTPASAGRPSQEEMQNLGTDVAEGSGLGT